MCLGFVADDLCSVFSAVRVMCRRKIPVSISSGICGASRVLQSVCLSTRDVSNELIGTL